MGATAICADPARERARRWKELGEKVRQALDVRASVFRPESKYMRAAASTVGVPLAVATRAWNFMMGHIECPHSEAPEGTPATTAVDDNKEGSSS